jgi:hypothetical protein
MFWTLWSFLDTFSVFCLDVFYCAGLVFASQHYFFTFLLFRARGGVMKFQVVSVKLLQGTAKQSGRPYKMLAVSGIHTDANGEMIVGEIVFMERQDAPLPGNLKPGETYRPVMSCRSKDGRLQFEISALESLQADAKPAPLRTAATAGA